MPLGYDAVAVPEIGLSGATDEQILHFAVENGRAIVTLDADFANINPFPHRTHARRRATKPAWAHNLPRPGIRGCVSSARPPISGVGSLAVPECGESCGKLAYQSLPGIDPVRRLPHGGDATAGRMSAEVELNRCRR